MSDRWVDVGEAAKLRPGKSMSAVVHGFPVAIHNVDGAYYATQDACPHQGVSLGCGGLLDGPVISCGYHYWEFDVRSGESVDGLGDPLWTLPIRVDGGRLWVALPEELERALGLADAGAEPLPEEQADT